VDIYTIFILAQCHRYGLVAEHYSAYSLDWKNYTVNMNAISTMKIAGILYMFLQL
jgi:hypothetical protein